MNLDLNKIPTNPGVYIFHNKKGDILYIGKAKNLKNRLGQYFSKNSIWKQDMLAKADNVEYMFTNNENEALLLEINLINKHRPPYNNLIKGDTSYIYIKITNDIFPQIIFTRYRDNDGAIYIGPKYYRNELKKLLQFLRQILKFRGCKNTEFRKGKLCTDYMFGICKGWCTFKDKSKMKEYLEESDKIKKIISNFFKGNTKEIEGFILDEIQNAIEKQNFERAASLRDILFNLKKFTDKQSVIFEELITGHIYKIKKIGDFFVYASIYLFEGKMIDVYRNKEKSEESDIEDIKNSLSLEYGEFKTTKTENGSILGTSKSIKKISTKTLNEIEIQLDNFIEGTILGSTFEKDNIMNEILAGLQKKYFLKNYPYNIECIDISHLSGGRVSGGLSALKEGIPNKKGYKNYKIKSAKGLSSYNNDYEALSEIIVRRLLTSDQQTWPDLFVIDGGKGQLGILQDLIEKYDEMSEILEKVDIISLGKGKARKNSAKTKGEKEKIFKMKIIGNNQKAKIKTEIQEFEMDYDEIDKILIKCRDESHRFANKFRMTQMKNSIIKQPKKK